MARPKLQRSSGNVFRDLGFSAEESENLRLRSELMIRLTRIFNDRGLTQADAARMLGITQPRVSDLVRGKIARFSLDTLVSLLGRAGMRVTVTARAPRRVA